MFPTSALLQDRPLLAPPLIRSGRPHRGFTLIELLTVITIVSVLAAVAIPSFLNRRVRAQDALARTDVRHLATAEESLLADAGAYGPIGTSALPASIQGSGQAVRPSSGVTLSVLRYDGSRGFCLVSRHAGSQAVFLYDSQRGGLSSTLFSGLSAADAACSIPQGGGIPGDSLTGA